MGKLLFIVLVLASAFLVRAKLQGRSRPAPAPELLTANEDSVQSLNYALKQFKEPMQEPVLKMPSAKETKLYLSQLRGLSHKPDMFSKAVQIRLGSLGAEQVLERTLLMQEMFIVLHFESLNYLRALTAYEQKWFAGNLKKITDKKSLHNYIQELVKITARVNADTNERLADLRNLAQAVKKDAFAMRSFRYALVTNSQWDITDIYENIPHDLKLYVQGKRK
jgi:hypothetical protein